MLSLLLSVALAAEPGNYPDPNLTPGLIETEDAKIVCKKGYTKDARHVTQATKNEVFKRYGFVKGQFKPGDYEIDHFISLELGGKNDIENLWPQHYCPVGNDPYETDCWGAREKDRVETGLHRKVCKGEMTLKEAQDAIRTDWIKAYKELKKKK